jgi:hypothetical protein
MTALPGSSAFLSRLEQKVLSDLKAAQLGVSGQLSNIGEACDENAVAKSAWDYQVRDRVFARRTGYFTGDHIYYLARLHLIKACPPNDLFFASNALAGPAGAFFREASERLRHTPYSRSRS